MKTDQSNLMIDLLSLPNEMLASVLKYSDYSTVSRLRNINKRINRVAQDCDVGVRVPVTSITLFDNYEDSSTWEYHIFLHSNAVSCLSAKFPECRFIKREVKFTNVGSHLEIIDKILKKVDLHGELTFHERLPFAFNDDLLAVLIKNGKNIRNMFVLNIYGMILECSEMSLRNLFSSAKKMITLDVSHCEPNLKVFLQTELYEQRHWDSISFFCDQEMEYPELNDDFLLKVVKNCKEFDVVTDFEEMGQFTVDGIVNLITALVHEGIIPKKIGLGRVTCDDVHEAENKIRSIQNGITCKFDSVFILNYAEIHFPSVLEERHYIHFVLESVAHGEAESDDDQNNDEHLLQ